MFIIITGRYLTSKKYCKWNNVAKQRCLVSHVFSVRVFKVTIAGLCAVVTVSVSWNISISARMARRDRRRRVDAVARGARAYQSTTLSLCACFPNRTRLNKHLSEENFGSMPYVKTCNSDSAISASWCSEVKRKTCEASVSYK